MSILFSHESLPLKNPKDLIREAYDNLKKSAEQGNATAQFVLGHQFFLSMKGIQNDAEAIRWFRKAAEQGHVDAQYRLGMLLDKYIMLSEPGMAFKYFLKAAKQGHILAQNTIGDILHKGDEPNPGNETALKWYLKAAEQGQANALFSLGLMYHDGNGVQQSDEKAFEYFLKAAKKGHKEAQFTVAQKFEEDTKYIEALKWYLKAAEQGHVTAPNRMEILLYNRKAKLALQKEDSLAKKVTKWILPDKAVHSSSEEQFKIGKKFLKGDAEVEQSYEIAFFLFLEAAEAGVAKARHEVGYMFIHGKGIDQSESAGFIWLLRAAEQGFAPSKQLIDDLIKKESRLKKIHDRALEFLSISSQCERKLE